MDFIVSKKYRKFSCKYLPCRTARGVKAVKTAVDNRPNDNVHFPPNFSARIPPGI